MRSYFLAASLAMAGILFPTSVDAAALSATTFAYQGQLKQGGVPADGFFDLQFTLFEANAIVAGPVCFDEVEVVNGLFRVELDFGNMFNGNPRELRVAVRPGGVPLNCAGVQVPNYVNLTPRQPITPTPYAIHALSAPTGNRLDAADGSPAGAVFVDNDGRVGIGNPAPLRTVDVFGAVSTLRLTGVTPNAPGGVIDLKHLQPQGIPGVTNSPGSIRFVDNTDAVMGSIDMIGMLNVPPNPLIPARLVISSSNLTLDADGNVDIIGAGQVDVESTGSSVRLRTGNATNVFVSSAGNVGIGSSAPTAKLHVVGTTQLTGNTTVTGNATVTGNVTVTAAAGDAALDLPDNAVSSTETSNESGLASDFAVGSVTLGETSVTLATRVITVPTAGFVVAYASAVASLEGMIVVGDANVDMQINKTTAPTAASERFYTRVESQKIRTLSFHAVFAVSAGSDTFTLTGRSLNNDCTAFNKRLTLMFFPTTYGTTDVED